MFIEVSNMADVQKDKYELPNDKWLQSHYTYIGSALTPEQQAIVDSFETLDEKIAYKERIMEELEQEILKKAEAS